MRSVASDVPTTAGISYSRASTAGCAANPPALVTSPAIFGNSTCQAGLVISHTRMSPGWTASNSASLSTTRATPSIVPGDPATPVSSPALRPWLRWNFSGKPHRLRYGKSSWVWVAVPTQSRGLTL